jgi:hypothetical protein
MIRAVLVTANHNQNHPNFEPQVTLIRQRLDETRLARSDQMLDLGNESGLGAIALMRSIQLDNQPLLDPRRGIDVYTLNPRTHQERVTHAIEGETGHSPYAIFLDDSTPGSEHYYALVPGNNSSLVDHGLLTPTTLEKTSGDLGYNYNTRTQHSEQRPSDIIEPSHSHAGDLIARSGNLDTYKWLEKKGGSLTITKNDKIELKTQNEYLNDLQKNLDLKLEKLDNIQRIAEEINKDKKSYNESRERLENASVDPLRSLQTYQTDFNTVKEFSTKIALHQTTISELEELQSKAYKIISNIQRLTDVFNSIPKRQAPLLELSIQSQEPFMPLTSSLVTDLSKSSKLFIQDMKELIPQLEKLDNIQRIAEEINKDKESYNDSRERLKNALVDPNRSLQTCQTDFNTVKGFSAKIALYQTMTSELKKLQSESDKTIPNTPGISTDPNNHKLKSTDVFNSILKRQAPLITYLDKSSKLIIQNVENFMPEICGSEHLLKKFLKKNKKPTIEKIIKLIPRKGAHGYNLLDHYAQEAQGFIFNWSENVHEQRLLIFDRVSWTIHVESPNPKSPEGCTSREWNLHIKKTEDHFDPRGDRIQREYCMDSNGELHLWYAAETTRPERKIIDKAHIIIQPPEQYISPIDHPEHYGLTKQQASHYAHIPQFGESPS